MSDSISQGKWEVLDLEKLNNSSVVQSLLDFNLSLLAPTSAIVSTSDATLGVEAEALDSPRDSMQLRTSYLEERLGVFQFAFWRVAPSVPVRRFFIIFSENLQLR